MGLTGSFKETSFADLLQFYAVSKQTVAVRVRIGASGAPDGVFFFADGELVGAALGGVEGRDAVRRALRLRDGVFTVEVGARLPDARMGETLRNVVMEEVVRLDEEDRAARVAGSGPARHAGGGQAGGGWWRGPEADPRTPSSPVPLPSPRAATPAPARAGGPVQAQPAPASRAAPPAAAAQPPPASAPAATPSGATPSAVAAPTRPAVRAAPPPPPRRRRAPLAAVVALAALAVAAAAVGGALWLERAAPEPAATAPAATKVRGVLDAEVVLGMVASFTGSNKERGRAMRLGWETAIAEANEAGGVHGRRLRLVAQDDGYDPARTGPAMKEVVEGEGAFAIVGNVGTATAAVAVPYCAEKGCVFFGALSGADILRRSPPDRHVFNYRASLAAEAAAAVRWLADVRRLAPARIAVLAQEDDFGRSGQRGALEQLRAYGVPESEVLTLGYPRNTADVREAIAKLRARADAVDAVVMVATYKPAATFVRKTKEAGLKLLYTTVSADSNGLAEELVVSGEGYTQGVLLTQVVPVPTAPATALMRYRAALERHAPGEKPGSTSLEAWIGAQIFLEGLRRAGRALDTDRLVAALESVRDWDIGIGAPITFGPADHQGSDVVFGWLLQPDGSYRQVELD